MGRIRNSWQQARTIPGLGVNLLALALIVIIGIVAVAFLIPKYRVDWPWSDNIRFSALVEESVGMKSNGKHAVNIAGIEVGQVTDVVPAPGGAMVTMSVDPAYPVYRDASVQVRSIAPINDVVVELGQGSPEAGPIGEEVVPLARTSRFVTPDQVLGAVDERARGALTQLVNQADVALREAPRDLGPGLKATDATVASLQPVVESLRTHSDSIRRLITDLSTISQAAGDDDQRLAGLITNLQATLDTLTQRDDELGKTVDQLPGVTTSLREALRSTQDLTDELDPTLDGLHDASEALPPALDKLTDTVAEARPLIKQLRPVAKELRPVVNDLRPLVEDLDGALNHLKPVTCDLVPASAEIAPWMPNLASFVFHTSSAFSLADANGGFGRANVELDLTDPTGGTKPMPEVGNRGPVNGSCKK